MRIVFIEPRVRNPVRISVALPMTFLALYSYIQAHIKNVVISYHSLELDHQLGKDMSLDSIYRKYTPDIVLSSAVSCNFSSAAAILRYFKSKGVTTMLGGIFASANDKWILEQHPFIDIIVRGEGERVLLNVLTTLQKGVDPSKIRSISFKRNGVVTSNEGDMTVSVLDDLPPLNFGALPVHLYREHCSRYYVFAARGCKYDCDFCSLTTHWGHKQRRFSPERALCEIDQLVNLFAPRQISFGDDTLELKSHYYQELLSALAHRQFPVKFGGKTRIDLVDAEAIALLKDAGFSELSLGVESNDTLQLKQLNKGSIAPALDRLKSTLRVASDQGFRINLIRQQSSTGMPVGECRPEIFWYKLMDRGKQIIRAYGISNRIPCSMDTKISEANPESWREGIPNANVAKNTERYAWGRDCGAEYPGGPYPHNNDHTPEVFGK